MIPSDSSTHHSVAVKKVMCRCDCNPQWADVKQGRSPSIIRTGRIQWKGWGSRAAAPYRRNPSCGRQLRLMPKSQPAVWMGCLWPWICLVSPHNCVSQFLTILNRNVLPVSVFMVEPQPLPRSAKLYLSFINCHSHFIQSFPPPYFSFIYAQGQGHKDFI